MRNVGTRKQVKKNTRTVASWNDVIKKLSRVSRLCREFHNTVCVPGLFRIFATAFRSYFACEVELSVAPVLSLSCASRVRLSMLIG